MTKARDLSQTPNASLGFKNRIINGDFYIDQRTNGALATGSVGGVYNCVDRWQFHEATGGTVTLQRVSDAPAGFRSSIRFTVTATDTSLASTEYCFYRQSIEGNNVADFGFGTANAETISLSFRVKSSVTGTFSGSIQNGAENRNYAFTYTINAANTWETKTVVISGDVTGTWANDNSIGLSVNFALGLGSTYTSAPNTWAANTSFGTSNTTNLLATSNATIQFTGVQLEKGSTATSFDYRPYGTELNLCQRYYQIGLFCLGVGASASTTMNGRVQLLQQMRATPSIGKTATTVRIGDMVSVGFTSTSSPSIESYIGNDLNVAFGLGGFTGLTSYRSYRHEPQSGDALFTMSAEL